MTEPRAEAPVEEQPSRRGVLKVAMAGISAVAAAMLAWPMVGSLVGPIYRRAALKYSRVKPLADIAAGSPVKVGFPYVKEDAFLREQEEHEVWVVKDQDKVTVFSPICPHLGCRVDWHPGLKQFICPCHGSVFNESGKVVGGPAPRALDTLPHKVVDGDLLVEWERFKTGVAQKIRV